MNQKPWQAALVPSPRSLPGYATKARQWPDGDLHRACDRGMDRYAKDLRPILGW